MLRAQAAHQAEMERMLSLQHESEGAVVLMGTTRESCVVVDPAPPVSKGDAQGVLLVVSSTL